MMCKCHDRNKDPLRAHRTGTEPDVRSSLDESNANQGPDRTGT